MIRKAKFVKSSASFKECPAADYPEFAFAGRSNVGKSSLINYLCNRKKIARTSSTPGKTMLINHYLIDEACYFVDLPGYGYARTGSMERERVLNLIFSYLRQRQSLSCLFLLLDSRLAPLENDKLVINWLGCTGIPFALVFTKTDKSSKAQLERILAVYRRELLNKWEELPPIYLTSSLKRSGRGDILEYIRSVL